MKYFYFGMILLIVLTQTSCEKNWLSAKPAQNLAVPATLQDFQALLDENNISNLYWPVLQEISSDGHYMTDNGVNTLGDYEVNAYTWTNKIPYSPQIPDWNQTYTRVYYCNLVIEGLQKYVPESSSDLVNLNNIKGQALYLRAMSFYEAAQLYAPLYDSSTAATDLGIPLRLSTDITIPTTRSTVKENFDQIISDLIDAKDLLPTNALYQSRSSKPAVFGLLARIYLSVGDYIDAGRYADSCLSLNSTLLDYNTLNANSGGNPPPVPTGSYNSEVIFSDYLQNYESLFPGFYFIDSALYSLYDSNDLRKTIFFIVNPDSTITFQGMYTFTQYYLFGGLATDEIFLIRAECYARAGNTSAAMADLNTLLQYRWKINSFIPFTATSADDALNQILTERKKELLLRGIRWSDLRRLNKDPRFEVTITRIVNGITYSLMPNSYEYTFPIPADIIQQSGIPQNKGW